MAAENTAKNSFRLQIVLARRRKEYTKRLNLRTFLKNVIQRTLSVHPLDEFTGRATQD